MGRLRLTLLGGFEARVDPGRVLRLRARQTSALLAYLALPCGRSHPRDKLASLLWGHLTQDEARNRLRQTLFALRKAFGPGDVACLQTDGDTLILDPARVEVDVTRFAELVAEGSSVSLERGVALYRGDLLQGLAAQGPEPSLFEEWLASERERLRELALQALARLLSIQRKAGTPERALDTALRILALDPLQEAVHRAAMRLHVQLGRRPAALRQYQVCVNALRRELNVEPDEETRDLYRAILRRRPILTVAAQIPRSGESPGDIAASDETPLIGREIETERLRVWLSKVLGGSCQVGLLVGETGVGKSRLVSKLIREARVVSAELAPASVCILVGRCHEGEESVPFGPWVDAFRAGRLAQDGTLLSGLDPAWRAELVRLMPEVGGSAVSVSSEPPEAATLFEAVRQLLARLIERSFVLLILEDLHWADEMSLRMLQFLAHRASGWPLLVVGTMREEELPDRRPVRRIFERLETEPHVDRVRVAPLSRRATLTLVRALSATTNDLAAVRRVGEQIWRVSAGNPFVVVETMRAVQHGIPLPGPGGLPLVERVRHVIVRRLDRLSNCARELATVGAVIGRNFEFSLLHSAAGVDEFAGASAVEELVRRQVLQEVPAGLDFVHERLRAVIYAELVGPRRYLLHRQVAAALQAVHCADPDQHSLAIAMHYREAGIWDQAADYFVRAGFNALSRSANSESVTCFEHAVDALKRLPETDETLRQAVDIRIALRHPLSRLGMVHRFGAFLEEAQAMVVRLRDQRREVLVASGRCHYLFSIGHNEEARRVGERAVMLARGLGDQALELEAAHYAALPLTTLGRYLDACGPIRALLDAGEHQPRPGGTYRWSTVHALACALLTRTLAEVGQFTEAFHFGEWGLTHAQIVENPFHIATAHLALGSAYLGKGDFPNATSRLQRALELIEAHEINVFLSAASACLGLAYAWSGRGTEGLALIDRALRQSQHMNLSAGLAKWMAYRAQAHLLSEQVSEAHRWAEAAQLHARQHGEPGNEALALRVLGEARAREGDRSEAERLYEEALSRARSLGLRPLSALCQLSLGTLFQNTNRPEAARAHLTAAMTMLEQMDMRFWLASARECLRRLHRAAR